MIIGGGACLPIQVAEVEALLNLPGWHAVWNCCKPKAGYSGTVTLSKAKPLSSRAAVGIPEFDDEGGWGVRLQSESAPVMAGVRSQS